MGSGPPALTCVSGSVRRGASVSTRQVHGERRWSAGAARGTPRSHIRRRTATSSPERAGSFQAFGWRTALRRGSRADARRRWGSRRPRRTCPGSETSESCRRSISTIGRLVVFEVSDLPSTTLRAPITRSSTPRARLLRGPSRTNRGASRRLARQVPAPPGVGERTPVRATCRSSAMAAFSRIARVLLRDQPALDSRGRRDFERHLDRIPPAPAAADRVPRSTIGNPTSPRAGCSAACAAPRPGDRCSSHGPRGEPRRARGRMTSGS